ncbi:uncharacterized protein LOC144153510 [Haemaphysalis longicornis]
MAGQVRSNVNVMLTAFFDSRGVVHYDYAPQGQTITKEHVDSLRDLCTERVSALLLLGCASVRSGLCLLATSELHEVAESVASHSPMRHVAWRDVAPLYLSSRLSELRLDRLLMSHADLRALLEAVGASLLTHLTVTKIRCMCQEDPLSSPATDRTAHGSCHEEQQRDVESLEKLVQESAGSLECLDTDFPLDVERLVASSLFPALRCLALRCLAPSRSVQHRSSLTNHELHLLLVNIPALRQLRCDVSEAIDTPLDPDVLPMLSRLEAVKVLYVASSSKYSEASFAASLERLATWCPNMCEVRIWLLTHYDRPLRGKKRRSGKRWFAFRGLGVVLKSRGPVVVRVTCVQDLVPLSRLRHLHRLTIRSIGRAGERFAEESVLQALGDAAKNIRHLKLPSEAHIRPEALSAACPALETLVAPCTFGRNKPWSAVHEDSCSSSSPHRRPSAPPLVLSSLREAKLGTFGGAIPLLPSCPELRRLTLTMPRVSAEAMAADAFDHVNELSQK